MAVERRRRRYPVTSPISLLASKLPFLSPRERTRDSAIPSRSRLTPSETSAYAPQQRSSTGGYHCSFRTVGPARPHLQTQAPCPLQELLACIHLGVGLLSDGRLCCHHTLHSGAEGILGEVVRPIQVSYLSESVSTSRFRICRTLNISLGSE